MQNLITGDAFALTLRPGEPKFDLVISNPPVLQLPSDRVRWELEHHPAFRFGPPLGTSDFNFIQLAVSSLKPGGAAVLLVRMTPLFASGKEREIREALLKAGCVSAVVSLASKLLPNTSAPCAMRAPSGSQSVPPIKLVAADTEFNLDGHGNRFLTPENGARILSALHSPDPQPGFSTIKTVEELAERDYSLVPMHYLLAERVPVNLGESTVMARTDKVAQIFRGPALGGLPPGEEPILQGRDLPVRHIYKDELERKELPADRASLVTTRLSDILVQRIGGSPKSYYFGWCIPVQSSPHSLYVACASSSDVAGEWQVFAFTERGIIARIPGRDRSAQALQEVYRVVQEYIEGAPGIHHVREKPL